MRKPRTQCVSGLFAFPGRGERGHSIRCREVFEVQCVQACTGVIEDPSLHVYRNCSRQRGEAGLEAEFEPITEFGEPSVPLQDAADRVIAQRGVAPFVVGHVERDRHGKRG